MDRTQHCLDNPTLPASNMYLPLHIRQLLRLALEEDLGQGDVLGGALNQSFPQEAQRIVRLHVVPREACVISGIQAVQGLIEESGLPVRYLPLKSNGMPALAHETIATLEGSLVHVLALERCILNLLQHLCGVATHTQRFVQAVAGGSIRIAHTRKTTPGLRYLEQQAVLHGGGSPHRYNLSHTAMVKDNTLATVSVPLNELTAAIRQRMPHTAKLEIECDSLQQITPALEAGADVLLLDNMTPQEVTEAVTLINGRATVEVSGGITLDTIHHFAIKGVDVISTSQITTAAPPIDIGLDAPAIMLDV
jgi:nicotinate-nucleotide pyrophosphorylase (carboxylating)